MTRPAANTAAARPPVGGRGFTLVELLVVIGIILLLVGILLPVTLSVIRKGQRSRTQADLQALSAALEAYKTDFYSYPRPTAQRTGAQVLCQAMIGPGDATVDGADGPGFRVRAGVGGRVYGPYVQADKFVVSGTGVNAVLVDRDSTPILYFPAFFAKANIHTVVTAGNPKSGGFTGENDYSIAQLADPKLKPLYNALDGPAALPTANFSVMLGDSNADGKIDIATEAPLGTGAYILWSAGGDQYYGPVTATVADVKKTDDVLVFGP